MQGCIIRLDTMDALWTASGPSSDLQRYPWNIFLIIIVEDIVFSRFINVLILKIPLLQTLIFNLYFIRQSF